MTDHTLSGCRRARRVTAACLAALGLACTPLLHASLQDGLVSYWPLDDVVGVKTPDLVSGYDLELVNLTAADLVAGRVNRAFRFENSRQTMLVRISAPGEQLPINQHPALTIAFWAKVMGTGQNDLRLFSEGSTANNNPLFNLGTANDGASGKVDYYFRQAGWTEVNHLKSEGEPLDGTWRHLAFVQQEDGSRALFIDGVLDPFEIPAKEPGVWNVNTTSIGGILRASPTHWVTGEIDEVMLWSRALSAAEVQQIVNEGLNSVIPPMTRGMVAYWPLDEVVGVKTPDLANAYDMELVNLTAADLVTGRWGNAFRFNNARQTMLKRVSAPGEQLPVNQYDALTISMWVNVVGTGQNDLRLFSEGSTANNNPLFNLGTANDGASGKVDYFFRQTGWGTVDHLKSEGEPLDGTWRHLAFVQQEDGARALYIDGVRDPFEIPAKEPGAWEVNTTSIGGILRASPTHWVTGDIDDVALWNRALEPAEITTLATTGTPVPFAKEQPLSIRGFRPDRPAVAVGDTVLLSWDVTKSVEVHIDQGVGNVTANTISGLGSIEVALNATRTFTLTLVRGTETLSATTTVYAIDGVAPGWTLIDNFDRYNVGLLNGQGGWADLDAVDVDVVEHNGNRFVSPNKGDALAFLPLGRHAILEGQQRTLFFRLLERASGFETIKGQIAVTDRPVRFGSDVGNNIGPGAIIDNSADTGFFFFLGGYNGAAGNVLEYGWDTFLDYGTVYSVWVDISNGPFEGPPGAPTSVGDTYSIYVQKQGETTRTRVINNFTSGRNPIGAADVGFTTEHLTRLIVGALPNHSTALPLLIDDIYLSKDGYNTTVPRAFGFTQPVMPADPPTLSIGRDGAQIRLQWSAGTLESADAVTGPFTPVAGATSPHAVTPTGAQRYYRARD